MSCPSLNITSEPTGSMPGSGQLPFMQFAEWLVAPVRLALLELAIELKLPDIVAENGGISGIAARLGTSRQDKLAYILDAMAASGLLYKENGVYRNTKLAESYLCKGKTTYLGDLLLSLKGMQHRNLCRLKDSLFSELPVLSANQTLHGEEHWKRSVLGLAGYQKAGAADALAEIAVALPGAEQFRTMLDIGCGPGVTALRILQQLPRLHLALCDFPHVLRITEEEVRFNGLNNRVSFRPGDYNCTDLGSGYDLIWACQSLYYAKDLRAFCKRLFDALTPGGLFVSIHEGIRRESTEPAMLILSRLSLALEGQDVSFTKGRIAGAAVEAGFTQAQSASLPMLYGDADCEVFQKPTRAGAV